MRYPPKPKAGLSGAPTGFSGDMVGWATRQFGVVKGKAQATLVSIEGQTKLTGDDSTVEVHTKTSASIKVGSASAAISAGAQSSSSDGISAGANGKISVGPLDASKSIKVDPSGTVTTSTSTGAGKSGDQDFKIGAGSNALVGGSVTVNFTQIGRALDATGESLSQLGAYLKSKIMPDPDGNLPTGGPPGVNLAHPF